MDIGQESNSKEDKKKKKKKDRKKSKTEKEQKDEEMEEDKPNPLVVINRATEMPEGASLSDGDDDLDGMDENDPHRALGDIVFDELE